MQQREIERELLKRKGGETHPEMHLVDNTARPLSHTVSVIKSKSQVPALRKRLQGHTGKARACLSQLNHTQTCLSQLNHTQTCLSQLNHTQTCLSQLNHTQTCLSQLNHTQTCLSQLNHTQTCLSQLNHTQTCLSQLNHTQTCLSQLNHTQTYNTNPWLHTITCQPATTNLICLT